MKRPLLAMPAAWMMAEAPLKASCLWTSAIRGEQRAARLVLPVRDREQEQRVPKLGLCEIGVGALATENGPDGRGVLLLYGAGQFF